MSLPALPGSVDLRSAAGIAHSILGRRSESHRALGRGTTADSLGWRRRRVGRRRGWKVRAGLRNG